MNLQAASKRHRATCRVDPTATEKSATWDVRTFQADTMAQALTQVRRELGRDAVILNTRSVKRGGLLGVGAKQVIEVTASDQVNVLRPDQRRRITNSAASAHGRPPHPPRQNRAVGRTPAETRQTSGLYKELESVKQMVAELVRENRRNQHPGVPQELFATYVSLINHDVADELADSILRQVQTQLTPDQLANESLVRHALLKCVEKMIPTAGPITVGTPGRPKVFAFVGPTGVGKTTTIAKLAANFRIRENKSVGLITIDTYRIAAVDQLKTYAGIINIPLRVVLSADELRRAVDDMKHHHLILIDTAGRSQNDQIKLHELKAFLQAARVDETHLVLSSTSSRANLQAIIREFAVVGIDKIVFTKLDEAVGVGMLLNVIKKLDRSISYITTGQNVPDDIEPGNGRRLAGRLLDQCLADSNNHKAATAGRGPESLQPESSHDTQQTNATPTVNHV